MSPSAILGPIKGIASLVAFLQLAGHRIFLAVWLKFPGLVFTYPFPSGPHALDPLYKQLAIADPKSSAAVPSSSVGWSSSAADGGEYSVVSLNEPS